MDHYNPNNNSDVSGLNQALVDELKRKGHVRTPQVEGAFRTVPRHLFVPGVPLENVYADRALPAKKDQDGQWLSSSSQPAMMAIMLEQLDLQPGHKVLEIGAGTGLNAALMAHIVGETGQVVTVDIEEDLVEVALRDMFSGLGLWSSLHGLEGHGLVARGDMVDRDIVPPLVSSAGFGGEPKSVSTGVLLGEGGLAALTRPPGQSAPLAETVDPCVFDSSFSLYVRQFGSAKSLAQRLVEGIRAWDAARRPSTQGLRVQAYAKDIDYVLSAGELMVEKELMRLVLGWSESAKGDNQ